MPLLCVHYRLRELHLPSNSNVSHTRVNQRRYRCHCHPGTRMNWNTASLNSYWTSVSIHLANLQATNGSPLSRDYSTCATGKYWNPWEYQQCTNGTSLAFIWVLFFWRTLWGGTPGREVKEVKMWPHVLVCEDCAKLPTVPVGTFPPTWGCLQLLNW